MAIPTYLDPNTGLGSGTKRPQYIGESYDPYSENFLSEQQRLMREREAMSSQGALGIQAPGMLQMVSSQQQQQPVYQPQQTAAQVPVNREGPAQSEPPDKEKGLGEQGGSGIGIFSGIVGGVGTIVNQLYQSADWWKNVLNDEPLANKRFDQAFMENKRKWNLEYALNEWAQRKGMALQEARDLFNQKMEQAQFDLNKLSQNENIQTARTQRRQSQYDFTQKVKSDQQRKVMGGKVVQALIRGLSAGKEAKV